VYHFRKNRLDITHSAHYNLSDSKPTTVSSTDTLSMLIDVGCHVVLENNDRNLGRAKLARIYILSLMDIQTE
jgi:hypothetical protein